MNPLQGLSEYLGKVERRLKVLTWSRGAALTAGAALGFTVAGVLIANHYAFSNGSVVSVRVLLFLALAAALGAGLVLPLLHLNRRRAARAAERQFPKFEERLLTFSERAAQTPDDPFLELLAADALEVARASEPEQVAPRNHVLSFVSAAAASVLVLVWLGTYGPGFMGYGTSLLWGAIPKEEVKPFYDIVVKPGDRTVRRKADMMVSARLVGFQSERVRLLAKFNSSSKWDEVVMRPEPGGTGYEFLFASVPEALEYYVEAGSVRSKRYKLNVIDLPGVKRLRVTYHYPAWTALPDKTEDPGGDLRAVEGTQADVAVDTDRPIPKGALVLDDGSQIELRDGKARVPIQKDGLYHVASLEQGEGVRLSEDYFIEAQKDAPPNVRITRPGRDAKVNPLEEVTVAVQADDDFGLKSVDLHYSVNGGPEKTVALADAKGRKTAEGSTQLNLEDFKLSPGDVVSMYASARDARSTAHTDMFFVLAEPFERAYTQSQQMGGAGTGGDEQGSISARQREIIVATWNQVKAKQQTAAAEAENAKFLADMQSKLRDQASSLAARMRSREVGSTNPAFQNFAEEMDKAVEAMTGAASKLRGRQWQGAMPPEEKALQHLSRAEAIFRDIQVAFGNRGGGGGGGAGRDLENLFDLELDTEKNQYESGQQSASADQRQQQIDEALQKLKDLARRQQELADQQRKNQQAFQQRWQQEMLRREAEELQKKLEQLAREQNQQGQQGQQGQQSQQGQQGQDGQQGQSSGGRSAQSAALDRALQRLTEATRDMRGAGSSQNNATPEGEAQSRRAAERLREAQDSLARMHQQQSGEQLDEVARKAQKLAEEEQELANRMQKNFGSAPGQPPQTPLAEQFQQGAAMGEQKLKMLEELKQLEREMQKAARDMAGTERGASSKLRQALGNMQQDELGLKMKWGAEALRRGMGQAALSREAPVTQGLNRLRDQVRDAQSALGQGKPGGQGLEQALAETERLRRQLEQMGRKPGGDQAGQSGQGGQKGQGGEGQQGQQDGQGQSGEGQSAQSGQGQSGQGSQGQGGQGRSGRGGQGQRGASPIGGPTAGPFESGRLSANGYDPAVEREIREGVRNLSQLPLEGNRDIARDIQSLARQWQTLEAGRMAGGSPLLDDRIKNQLLGEIEQIELQLRRLVEDKQGGNVRSGASQPVPPGYANAVAEYFRKLSKDK